METNSKIIVLRVRDNESGVALVIVLSMIVLLSAIMVAFMSRVSNEGRSAKMALQGFEARQAAETAVNLVISQLRSATYDPSQPRRGWASQPGAIRTFSGGQEGAVYKLYSAKTLVETSAYDPSSPEEAGFVDGDLSKTPLGYVDINTPTLIPVKGQDGDVYYEAHFPIADPRAKNDEDGDLTTNPGTGVVQGFHSANVQDSGTNPRLDRNKKPVPRLPMNVRWLFQLRDGSLVAGEADGDSKLKLSGASRMNPPVSRIAFWTDDESCKLNLNTASENTYWDTPAATSEQESGRITLNGALVNTNRNPSLSLAASQPTSGEYQRFPGHPATTSLSPALRWLFPDKPLYSGGPQFTELQFKEAIYRLAPRIMGGIGSSMGATRNPLFPRTDNRVFERDRLLSTVDDYFFRPDRSPMGQQSWYHVFQTSQSENPEVLGVEDAPSVDFANPYFTAEALQRMRFFLTTTSRAPEVNLFGLPRMSIWPINSDVAKQSAYDKLIAFCSTIGGVPEQPTAGSPFYFQRANPWSPTQDMLPNSRNDKLYEYMFRLLGTTNPAAGGSFTDKYGTDAAQILTQIFDYIRSTNLIDTHNSPAPDVYPLAYTAPYGALTGGGNSGRGHPGAGQVVPLRVTAPDGTQTKGFGRFPTVVEVAIIFYHDDIVTSDAAIANGQLLANDDSWTGGQANSVPIRCALAVEMFTPSPGYPMLAETYAMSVNENVPFKIRRERAVPNPNPNDPTNYEDLNIAPPTGMLLNYVDVNPWRAYDGRFFMPGRGFWNQMMYETSASAGSAAIKKLRKYTGTDLNLAYESYPFVSKRFVLSSQGNAPTHFRIQPGQFTIRLHPVVHSPTHLAKAAFNTRAPADTSPANVIQTFVVNFRTANAAPEWTLPVPISAATTNRPEGQGFLHGRGTPETSNNPFPGDTIRSMEIYGAARGDYRLTGAMRTVPATFFTRPGTLANYQNIDVRQAHNLRSSWGRKLVNSHSGKLVENESPRSDKVAKVAFNMTTGVRRTGGKLGDFDRGISKHVDGPFINKPDEGNVRFEFTDDFAGGGAMPYYRGGNGYEEIGESYFTPNRLVSSAVMFGSLPNGVLTPRPWETLLFRPGPRSEESTHRGAVSPKDHYLLDLFHMPVVEPYAVSEPLSTAGKININCKIAPFGYYPDPENKSRGYIERYTGIHGLLKGVYQFIAANGTPEMGHGEQPLLNARTASHRFRLELDPLATVDKALIPLLNRKGGYFKSATEICELDLLTKKKTAGNGPEGFLDPETRDQFWEQENALTGDNQRERPYAHIYPRTTTKSNVFTVHVWSQSLAKAPTGDADVWDETRDSVTGEYRGSTIVERFIDPNDRAFQNGGDYEDPALPNAKSLDALYRYRIVSNKAFTVRE
jgi:uncharacterized protein (TIGR02600 family)